MVDVTIDDLNPKATPVDADQIELDDGVGGSFKTTKAQLLAGIQAEVDLNTAKVTNANHTGEVQGSQALTITNGAVTNAKLANMNPGFKGRQSIPGSPEDLTVAQAQTLLNVEDGSQANQNDAEIKAQYEANANTNAFTDAEQSKLTGIEAGAEVNQTDAEVKAQYEANANTNAFTDAEQTKLGTVDSGAQNNTNSNAGGGAGLVQAKVGSDTPIKSLTAGTDIQLIENADDVSINYVGSGAPGTVNEVTKDGANNSVNRATLEFRDTGDATVTVTDDAGNDRTIISIDATAGAGGGGVGKGDPFVVGELLQVESAAGDGTIETTGVQIGSLLQNVADDLTPELGGPLGLKAQSVYQDHTAAAGVSFVSGEVGLLTDAGVVKANATSAATGVGRLVTALDSIAGGASGRFALSGYFLNADFSGSSGGDPVYLDTVDGDLTPTAPTGSGNIVRIVGYVESASFIYIDPGYDWLELA